MEKNLSKQEEQEGDPRMAKLSEYIKSKIEKEYPLVDVSLDDDAGEFFFSITRKGAGTFIGYASFDSFEELETYLLEEKYKEWLNVGENTNKKDFKLREGDIEKN